MSKKLPFVTSDIPRDLRSFLDRMRELVSGSGADRLLSANDLVGSGLATVDGSGNIKAPPAVFVGTPPAPTNVTATAAIRNIIVAWDNPAYVGHAHAEVWGSSTSLQADSVLLGMTPGAIYVDEVGPSVTRYYWVRFVNTNDTPGPYNALVGTPATTGSDVAYLLDTLTDAALDPASDYSKFAVRADFFYVMPSPDFSQEATPTATATGDLWYQPSTELVRTWTGSTWGSFSQTLPFVVNSSPQTINGVAVPAGVYMDAAFIKNGTITNAKIGNAAIDDAKIANLSAGKITAGDISVGNYIQSTGFIAGSQGWKIGGNGVAEFAAASIRGQLTASQINSNGLSIRDTSGNIILNAGTGDFTGSLNGTATSTVVNNASTALSTANSAASTASSAQSTANTALSGLSTKLNNNARNVLAGSGGLATGTLNWNSSGVRTSGFGVGITQAGLAAYNSAGVATFVLNGTTGAATFAGALSAATGSFAGSLSAASGTFSGSLSAATGTFSGSLTAGAINAVNTINIAGNAVTVPSSVFTAASFKNTTTNTWQVVQSLTVTTSGNRVYITSSGNKLLGYEFSGDSEIITYPLYRLLRGTTELMRSAEPSMSYSETPSSGTYTYYLEVLTDYFFTESTISGAGISNRSMFLIETKR